MLFESNDNLTLKEVQRRTRIILDALDAAEAMRLLRAIADDISLKEQAQQFVLPLELVAFPLLSREDAARLLREHLSDFFRFDVSLADRLRVRFVFAGYDLKDEEQVILRGAFEKSISRMGSQSIAEWIVLLKEKIQEGKESREMVRSLTTSNQDFAALDKQAQAVLQSICLAYIDQLIFPLIDDIDEAYMAQGERGDSFVSRSVLERSFVSGDTSFEKLSLLKALGKFEKLGGQQVTNSKIVVKGQNDPVRPTIFNWLRAYRDDLGVGSHDSVVRGQFLFQSINGKGLSADEREQVGMLLRSLDDNTPLTIDAGRQEVIFSESRIKNQESRMESKPLPREIPNTKYEIQNTASLPTQNISRAVFEMPVMKNQESGIPARPAGGKNQEIQDTRYKIQDTNQGIPSAFEQAKAIQAAARENQISMAKVASETVELGRVNVPREEIRLADAPLKSGTTAPHPVAPAPRAISFEPAKIDTFSFGSSVVREQKADAPLKPAERPLPMQNSGRTAPKAERPMFANGDNVGELSFSTKHVMPAEKEINSQQQTISKQELTDSSKQGMGNSGRTAKIAERPLQTQTADAPARGGQAAQAIVQPVPTQKAPVAPVVPTPPIQKPVMPVNRFRITPTGRRDSAPSDATPSPHVVDLRN